MASENAYLLIVEDVPDILELLKETLTFKGYRVVTAVNGEEALKAVQEEHPALIDLLKIHISFCILTLA